MAEEDAFFWTQPNSVHNESTIFLIGIIPISYNSIRLT